MIAPSVTNQSAALVEQGVAAMKAGNKEGAIAALRLATELAPDNETAWLWLASLYTEMQSVAQCLQRVLTINPANEQAKRALLVVIQKMQAAANSSAQSADHNPSEHGSPSPSNEIVERNEGNAGMIEEAPTPSNSASQQSALALEVEEYKRRGIVAAKGGRYAEAKDYLMAAVTQNESDPETWYWLSTVIDDPEDKQIALENVLTLDPNHAGANTEIEANRPALERQLLEKQKTLEAGHGNQNGADAEKPMSFAGANEIAQSYVNGSQGARNRNSGSLTGQVPTPQGGQASKRENTTRSAVPAGQVIAEKYTALHPIKGSSDIAAWDAKKRRFYILRPMNGDASDLRSAGGKARVTHDSVSYVVLPIETKGISLSSFIRTVGALPAELVTQYGLSMLKRVEDEQANNPSVSAQKSLRPDTITFDASCNIVLEPPSESHVTMSLSSDAAPYLPPEQLERGLVTATSDIYSIGAILYFMLTGSPPPPPDRIYMAQGSGPMPISFPNRKEIPNDLAQVITTAIQPNPLERYPSALVMYEALKALGAKRQDRKGRSIWQVIIAVAILCVAVLGLLIVGGNLKGIKLPFGAGNDKQSIDAAPTSVPIVAVIPTPTPPPLETLIISAVDSRRFPGNTVYVSALDPAGIPLAGLTASSVKLSENGVDVMPVELTGLQNTLDSVSIIVALDTSDKMSGKTMDDAKTAIHILADAMQPGDHMALVTFGGSAQLAVPYTVSKSAFLLGVDRQEAGDQRAIEDVFALASSMAKEQPQGGYTALIVITNGGLPAKQPDMTKLVSPANGANLPVFFVGMDPATYPATAAPILANLTGGTATAAAKADTGEIAEAVKKIEKQLHNVYKLTYDSQASGYGADHNLELSATVGAVTKTDKRAYQVWAK